MNYKKQILYTVIVFVLLFGLGWTLMNAARFGICPVSGTCLVTASEIFGTPLVVLSISILISLFVISFFQESVYHAWKKFVIWFLPLWVLVVALTPTYSSHEILPFMELDRSISAIILGIIYLVVSLAIIVHQTLSSKRSKR